MTEDLIPLTGTTDLEDAEEAQSMSTVIKLLNYDQISEQKVLQGVKGIFKGFDYTNDSVGIAFKSPAELATYTQNTMDDIKSVSKIAETTKVLNKAAMLARFWYLGDTINKALQKSKWGTAQVQELAAALKKSAPYIYQIRAVAAKLTVIDCYLLGMRDVDTTHLRKLAQIKDDETRTLIIRSFIDSIPDTSDPERLFSAKKRLKASLNLKSPEEDDSEESSDPTNGGSETYVSPEYTEAMSQLKKWVSIMKKAADPEGAHNLRLALSEFFIMDSVPDAEKHLSELKQMATGLAELMSSARNAIDDTMIDLQSILAVEVTKTDETGDN